MKKTTIIVLSVILALIIGAVLLLQNVNFNRLGADEYYVQINKEGKKNEVTLDSGEKFVSYDYTLQAYNANGEEKTLSFMAMKELRKDAYLCVFVKEEKRVTSYQEVKVDELPDKAKEKLAIQQ
ncbi:YxeA family protein [Brevibacillus antibioticus]|uniref:YxeA family protein n=1 Tax=Brevibacillus antibioticus TaxID=2570228 RepID=A0A4U2Y969_9BACL|nr:YxeA family protein [Brevibacillus antibioticus]TKI56775.1 YxeA family protein [Brevibacillus antibioticus]